MISGDPPSFSGEFGTSLEGVDGISCLAELWFVDVGRVIPIQDLDSTYKTSTELAYEAINARAPSADEWTTAHTAFVGGGMAARHQSFITCT